MISSQFDQVGRTLGPAVAQQQVPPIGIAVDQLEKEISYLRESIRALEQRLSPVMRAIPEMACKDNLTTSGGSPLVNQLDMYRSMIQRSSADVRLMIDCLEL